MIKLLRTTKDRRAHILKLHNQYKSSRDGSLFQENSFLVGEKPRIILKFNVDDFETCNPLGTSRKTHKLCAVYWVLANLPPGSHSSLLSIYLSVLCKTNDVKAFGLEKIFEPLVQDLKTLEEQRVYVPLLGESVKGTVLRQWLTTWEHITLQDFWRVFLWSTTADFAAERKVIFSYILLHLVLSV